MECYGFIVNGLISDNEKDAWKTFDIDLGIKLKWIKGYKYWRVVPTLNKQMDFESNKSLYRVRAGIIVSEIKIKGLIEMSAEKPYPKPDKKIDEYVSSLGEFPEKSRR